MESCREQLFTVMALHLSGTNWLLLDKFLWNFILGEQVLQSAKTTEGWLKMDKSQQPVGSSTASCGISFPVCCSCDYVFYSAHTAVWADCPPQNRALTISSTYLHVSMWKQVLRKEQSPRLSSVCFWIIFLKCSFLHGSAELTLVHSTLVPCGQNSITCAPATQSAAHINYCLSFEICAVQLNYSSGIWYCINRWTVPDVFKECTAFTLITSYFVYGLYNDTVNS